MKQNETKEGIIYLPIEKLLEHKDNPRKELGDLTELADSIKQNGVLQNLTVVRNADDSYTILIGHRRKAAAQLAGLTELPCIIVDMTPQEQVGTMLLENMQRSDLTIYEQSQGFQMMIDLGESIDTIAKKTGFSKTTVNRRLEMAKLNQEVLKEVSSRQISIGDIDRLALIENLEKRNEVLKVIGTHNFNQSVEYQLKKQNIQKNMDPLKEAIRKLGANKITRSQTYGNEYTALSDRIKIDEWKESDSLVPDGETRKLFYELDEDFGTLRFYYKTPKAKPQKRPQAEIDRENYIRETRSKLDELSETAFNLRKAFISKVSVTKNNERAMLEGAAGILAVGMHQYLSNVDNNMVYSAAGIEYCYGNVHDSQEKFLKKFKESPAKIIPALIYNHSGDDSDEKYYSSYNKEFPHYNENRKLDMIYKWLVSIGYEMSDDEIALQNGTHKLMIDRDKADTEE